MGVEIIDADIATTKDEEIALNTFIASYKYKSLKLTQGDIKELTKRINSTFSGIKEIKTIKNSKSINSHFNKKTKITDSVDSKKNRNVITIETIDSSGILVKIAKVLKEFNTSIHSAKITTLGEKVEDTFFIVNNDLSLISKTKINKIKKALEEVI